MCGRLSGRHVERQQKVCLRCSLCHVPARRSGTNSSLLCSADSSGISIAGRIMKLLARTGIMFKSTTAALADAVREAAHQLTGAAKDYDPLLELIGDARFVLIGEASHGTHEFYRERALITRRLIAEKGFTAV